MKPDETTNIRIAKTTRNELNGLGCYGENANDILNKITTTSNVKLFTDKCLIATGVKPIIVNVKPIIVNVKIYIGVARCKYRGMIK